MTRRTPLALLLLAPLLGCSRSDPPPQADPAAPAAVTRAAPAEAPAPSPPEAPDAALVVKDGRVSADLDAQSVSGFLRRLGRLAAFQVVGFAREDGPVPVRAQDEPIEALVARLLAGEPYALRYAVDEASGAHRLERLVIGAFESELQRMRRERNAELQREALERRAARLEREQQMSPEEREALARERARKRAERQRQIEEGLASAELSVRAKAMARVDPDEEGLPMLLQTLASDPAPEVRAAAASALAGSEGLAAMNALVAALADPDPEVVIEVLDAIAFSNDRSVIPQLRPLLQHSDPDVRVAAAETIEFLE